MEETTGFLENWQDALFFWSFIIFTAFITWRILVSKPLE